VSHLLQNRDYDDEDYVAGGGGVTIKSSRVGDKRLGGMPGAAGGIPRSSSDMSLAATHAGMDPRLNKRLKNQMAPKPGEPGQPRCGAADMTLHLSLQAPHLELPRSRCLSSKSRSRALQHSC
jgi:hypothetical protein